MSNALVLTPLNGEPRIHDLLLAEQLGFEEPRSIRKLIKRNEDKLLKVGNLFKKESIGITKKIHYEYYLNLEQINIIETISRVKKNSNKKHIYVVEFSNGVIKVGHSDCIERRVSGYINIANIFNYKVDNIYKEIQLNTKESHLIDFCNKIGDCYAGKEYFVNVKFCDVVEFIKNNNGFSIYPY